MKKYLFGILLLLVPVVAIAMTISGTGSFMGGSVTVPSAPTGGTVVTASNTSLTLNPGTSSGATSYNAYYCVNASINSDCTPTSGSTLVTGVTNGSTLTSLTTGSVYVISYTAVNASGESGLSTAVSALPATYFSNTFIGTDGNVVSSSTWTPTQAGTAYYLSNAGKIAASPSTDAAYAILSDTTFTTGMYVEAKMSGSCTSNVDQYWQLGLQQSSDLGQNKSISKVYRNNNSLIAYDYNASGTGTTTGTFSSALTTPPSLPLILKVKWTAANTLVAYINGAQVGGTVTLGWSLSGNVRPFFELYTTGSGTCTCTVDNFVFGKE